MSAKKSKQSNRSAPPPPAEGPAVSPSTPAANPAPASHVPWIESSNPRQRLIAQIVLVGAWIYVAALCLLAVDKWFNLGIFGPKMPPLP